MRVLPFIASEAIQMAMLVTPPGGPPSQEPGYKSLFPGIDLFGRTSTLLCRLHHHWTTGGIRRSSIRKIGWLSTHGTLEESNQFHEQFSSQRYDQHRFVQNEHSLTITHVQQNTCCLNRCIHLMMYRCSGLLSMFCFAIHHTVPALQEDLSRGFSK